MREEFIKASIDHGIVEISKTVHFHGFVLSKPLVDPIVSHEVSDIKDLMIVLETTDSNPCRKRVTLASHHCYYAVWR